MKNVDQLAEPGLTPYEAGRRFAEELLARHPLTDDMAERMAALLIRPHTDQTRRGVVTAADRPITPAQEAAVKALLIPALDNLRRAP